VHRSRLYGLFVDTPVTEAAAAATFWSAALGAPAATDPDEAQFTMLADAFPGLAIGVQSVDDAPRYHVDIETDDVVAETARLTGLGAIEVARWLDCHVLRAPGGHLLCVVPIHSDPELFAARSTLWP
jgi:hypothetical protein